MPVHPSFALGSDPRAPGSARQGRRTKNELLNHGLHPQFDRGPRRRARVVELRFVEFVVQAVKSIQEPRRFIACELRKTIALADIPRRIANQFRIRWMVVEHHHAIVYFAQHLLEDIQQGPDAYPSVVGEVVLLKARRLSERVGCVASLPESRCR